MNQDPAVHFQVLGPEADATYCVGTITYASGGVAQTPIETWTELNEKLVLAGLDIRDAVINPAAASWLKNNEGWPGQGATA